MSSLLFTNVTAILSDKRMPFAFVLCEKGDIQSVSQLDGKH